tara:strand:- start:1144 stop:1689 length:546 start_codon:yes stop_codon:yes gene_type:complete
MAEKMTMVFDLETNGLLHDLTRIHCLSIYDTETNEIQSFNDERNNQYSIVEGLSLLSVADWVVGHNICGFDLPCIRKLYNFFKPPKRVLDTLLLSRLYHPNLLEIDWKRKDKGLLKHMPLQLFGRHSLEAWGHRLNEYKGEFGKTTDWKEWSPEMQMYCEQDVAVTTKLCDHFHPYLTGSR